MLTRELETELMDDPNEAIAYDEMDHVEVNAKFVTDLLAAGLVGTDVLDMGTGTARIPVELCKREPNCRVFATDGATSMLEIARYNVSLGGFDERIQLHYGDSKQLNLADEMFDTIISNSLIHHVPQPERVVAEIVRLIRPGGRVFIRDLCRPATLEEVDRLVDVYAADAPPLAKQMFDDSLRAALSLEEIRDLVARFGFHRDDIQLTSDRHWTWSSLRD
ncbi:MAG: class I SAM-dependent methyltransferase [Pirellulales bacterium]